MFVFSGEPVRFPERIVQLVSWSGSEVYPPPVNFHFQIKFYAEKAHEFHAPENDNKKYGYLLYRDFPASGLNHQQRKSVGLQNAVAILAAEYGGNAGKDIQKLLA